MHLNQLGQASNTGTGVLFYLLTEHYSGEDDQVK